MTHVEDEALGHAGPSTARESGSRIAVIDKAVAVLDALLPVPEGLTPTELAARLETNRSTAFRLLTSLEQAGLLQRTPSNGRYRLGLKLLRYGGAVRAAMDIVKIAEPALQQLRDATRQTTLLAMREGWGARCLVRLPGPEVDVLSWATGEWLPFHVGGATQALLAALDDRELEQYLETSTDWQTGPGRRTAAEIRERVARIREQGWALNQEEVTRGVVSLGAVIPAGTDTEAQYSISIAGLAHHYTGDDLDRTALSVQETARSISRQLRA